jgi:hypothetical protein
MSANDGGQHDNAAAVAAKDLTKAGGDRSTPVEKSDGLQPSQETSVENKAAMEAGKEDVNKASQPQPEEQPKADAKVQPNVAPVEATAPVADAGTADDDGEEDKDSDDDEAEIVEESPCGRWLKRREEVKYRDVPGIDTAYLGKDGVKLDRR